MLRRRRTVAVAGNACRSARSWPLRRSSHGTSKKAFLGGLTAVLTIATALPFGGAAAQSQGADMKPTILFVHGAWADGSGWSKQIAPLQATATTSSRPSCR